MKLSGQLKSVCEVASKPSNTLQQELKSYDSKIKGIAQQVENLALELYEEDPAYGDVNTISKSITDAVLEKIK